MAPTGARRPFVTRGADTELVDTAEVVDGSTDEEVGAEVELIAEADGPAEADGVQVEGLTRLRGRSPYCGGESVGVKLT
jgi:hypothetical protein